MHGVILSNLKHYVVEKHGSEAWQAIRQRADLAGRAYVPIRIYPDRELDALLEAAVSLTGATRDAILEDFGEWVIPPLIRMYKAMIPTEWDAVTFLLNMEERIHQRVIRMKDPEAKPPRIDVTELAPGRLEVSYKSHRNMSALAIGCVRGVAAYYGESVSLLEEGREESGQRRFVVQIGAPARRAVV
ncbi:Heme NO binding domain-containing protein [Alcanivorax hongdengensis A-11-3]|uniref:Heme NO binding domain-containing protein n=1 Tax=Alcanivorax hongdengensis A-11-3 TaxID=1177179 RepID=L0WFQ9_9GAMM|nr:heme NO-binding domain-containing protein [Alcanivorax hongdengensis]EKF75688.1 Heme NO binding domain-containing protein [Alcanivorax hongdengensis A-11-3]